MSVETHFIERQMDSLLSVKRILSLGGGGYKVLSPKDKGGLG